MSEMHFTCNLPSLFKVLIVATKASPALPAAHNLNKETSASVVFQKPGASCVQFELSQPEPGQDGAPSNWACASVRGVTF